MRILFILPQIPYPPESGGRIVTWNLLRRFAGQHDCWVACLYHHENELESLPVVAECVREIKAFPAGPRISPARMLRSLFQGRPYKAVRFWNSEMSAYIQDLIRTEKIDVVHAQNFYAAQYVRGDEPCLRVHYKENIEGRVMARYAGATSPPWSWLLPVEAWRTLRFERRLLGRFHHVLSISNHETETLRSYDSITPIHHFPPGVDLESHPVLPEASNKQPVVLFTGTFSYPPNDQAARWFLERVWTRVWSQLPGVRLQLVGNAPRAWLREWNGREGVEVTGRVPAMRPFYENASLVIVPLLVGGGVKLKLLEAMALGRPVVTTSIGAEGIELEAGNHVEVADDAEEFAGRVVALLQDPRKRRTLAAHARRLIEERYDWDTLVDSKMRDYEAWIAER